MQAPEPPETEPREPCEVLIAGAGNLGNVLLDCLAGDGRWTAVGFLDDAKTGQENMLDLPVFRPETYDTSFCRNVFMAIGAPQERAVFVSRLAPLGLSWMTYVDRRSHVSARACLGEGSLVFPFASIGPGTRLGRFSYVGAYASVGTKAALGDYTSLMPRSSAGHCSVGAMCTIGFNSACLDGATLEDEVFVAPYTWVRKHVPNRSFVSGTPARIRRSGLPSPHPS